MDRFHLILSKIKSRSGQKRAENRVDVASTARRGEKGQSFIELALVIPILILLVLGVVEVALLIGRYLDLLDLTREAARFASVRDPDARYTTGTLDCSDIDNFDFYFHTSCIFSPPKDSPNCLSPTFCNGLNPYLVFDPARDDVVISVYTVTDDASGNNVVTNVWPYPKTYWALSNASESGDPANENWKKDCEGNANPSAALHFNSAVVDSMLRNDSPTNKGFVAVEVFYCYEQALNIPIVTDIIPNPLRLNAYTLMPLPEAAPTPTPLPSP